MLFAACASCEGPQSALEPAGSVAARLADLFWGMTVGAAVIFVAVVGLAVYAMHERGKRRSPRLGRFLVVGGGVVFPTLVLFGLLTYGLIMLPEVLAPAPERSLRVAVSGEQWWWRVRYLPRDSAPVDAANEIRLPVNQPVEFELMSPDVIHSFWIPVLGGKMDMLPGRKTRLALTPTKTGTFRGVCAEFCGASHALMAFPVVVMKPDAFVRWLARQRTVAVVPQDASTARGRALFLSNGCGSCHSVRGTPAHGVVGPDLTHVGSRLSLGAGVLPNDAASFRRFIAHTSEVKPHVRMPTFGMLTKDELDALSTYLEALQ